MARLKIFYLRTNETILGIAQRKIASAIAQISFAMLHAQFRKIWLQLFHGRRRVR